MAAEAVLSRRYRDVCARAMAAAARLEDRMALIRENGSLLAQVSTIAVATFGASMVISGELTTGGLAACTLLAGRSIGSAMAAFTPLSAENRFAALVSGNIDVLSRNTTWTLAREASLGVQFSVVTYYDGQGFLVRTARGATSIRDLGGTSVCVGSGTTTELNLADHFRANGIDYRVLAFSSAQEAVETYAKGRCDVLTGDISQLYAIRAHLEKPEEHAILPVVISKEPLGPAVRQGDDRWLNVVKWVHYAMIDAEELGITQATLPEVQATSDKAEVKRLLGVYGGLGLTNDWAVRVVRHVGNYGESFERNLGSGSVLAIPRGPNRLWTDGGLQYAPPIR